MGAITEANYGIRLRTFLALHNVELYLVALFERFVSVQLNRRIMDEDIRPIFASDKTIALGVVKPLDLTFVLSHRPRLPWLLNVDPGGLEGNPNSGICYDALFV